jgi:hypothetical protein
MKGRRLLSLGVLLIISGAVLLVIASVRANSSAVVLGDYGYVFDATGYFHRGETVYVWMRAYEKWPNNHYVTEEIQFYLNVSFVASDGGRINLTVWYDGTPSSGGYGLTAPDYEVLNVSATGISGDPPVSEESAVALGKQNYLGGIVQRDCNLTIAFDKKTIHSIAGSDDPPYISLRKSGPVFPYSYLLPFGVVLPVLGVPPLVIGWRRRERAHHHK